jgi:hypothetical protein
MRVTDDVADGELLKSFELSRQKYKKRKEQVGAVLLPGEAVRSKRRDCLSVNTVLLLNLPVVTLLVQVGNRQKDTLDKLKAFTQKLRTSSTQKQQQQDKAAAAATKAAQEAAAVQQQAAADEAAAAAAGKQEAANGSGDKEAAAGADEAYDGKVGFGFDLCHVTGWRQHLVSTACMRAPGSVCHAHPQRPC